jgi:predicted porin
MGIRSTAFLAGAAILSFSSTTNAAALGEPATSPSTKTDNNTAVILYGQLQAELANFSDETPHNTGNDGLYLEDRSRGRLGIKTVENLDNGMKVFLKYEMRANITDTSPLTTRDALIGVNGDFGSLSAGRLRSPYKYTGGVTYDVFNDTTLEAKGHGGMSPSEFGHEGFLSKTIAWQSENIDGFHLKLLYAPEKNDELASGSVKYNQDNFEIFAAVIHAGDRLVNPTFPVDKSGYAAQKYGGSYSQGGHTIRAQYEFIEQKDVGGAKTEPKVFFLGYTFSQEQTAYTLQYGSTDHDQAGVDDTTYAAVGITHKYSKSTRMFGGYRSTTDEESVFSLGMRMDFSTN